MSKSPLGLAFLLFSLAILVRPLHGAREFVLSKEGTPLPGGQVCFYRTADDVSGLQPHKLYFNSGDVRCLPSDTVLEFPAGRFFFFGRHSDGLASRHRYLLHLSEPSLADCYARVRIDVVPSATLRIGQLLPSLGPGDYIGVWIGDAKDTLGTFLPVIPGEKSIQVAAETMLIPLRISNGKPSEVGEPLVLKAGQSYDLPALSNGSQKGTVVIWFDADRTATESRAKPTITPDVFLTSSAGRRIDPVTKPLHAASLAGSLLFFRNVPPGKAMVSVEGDFWSHDNLEVFVAGGSVTVASRGLRTRPAGAIRVSLPAWLSEFVAAHDASCGDDVLADAGVDLLQCKENDDDVNACSPRTRVALTSDGAAAPVRFTSIATGTYTVSVTVDKKAVAIAKAIVTDLREEVVVLEPLGTLLSGVIRKGRDAVAAVATFATGDRGVSTAAGKYYALLKADPGTLPIKVRLCDNPSTLIHIPEDAPRPPRAFDIDLPDNALRLTVVDAKTGGAIENAKVTYSTKPAADGGVPFFLIASSDAKGSADFGSVVVNEPIVVCAEATAYARKCTEPFRVGAEEEVTRNLSLESRLLKRGRLLAVLPISAGRIFFIGPAGQITEGATVSSDGTFSYSKVEPRSSAVFVSASHPLYVVKDIFPANDEQELTIAFRESERRQFVVRVERATPVTARIGLAVDGVNVPSDAFAYHQALRGAQAVIVKSRPVLVRDIVVTGPLLMRFGPDPTDTSYPPDAVSRPEYVAAFPAKVLAPGQVEIRFP